MRHSKLAIATIPSTYRYDGDELPDRDSGAKREGFDMGMKYVLTLVRDEISRFEAETEVDGDESQLAFGYRSALQGIESAIQKELE